VNCVEARVVLASVCLEDRLIPVSTWIKLPDSSSKADSSPSESSSGVFSTVCILEVSPSSLSVVDSPESGSNLGTIFNRDLRSAFLDFRSSFVKSAISRSDLGIRVT